MWTGGERVVKADVVKALEFVAKVVGCDVKELEKGLLGTTRLTFIGKRESSGDVDVALDDTKYPEAETALKLADAVGEECSPEKGTKSGTRTYSYAVPVGGKKVQVDVVFVKSLKWATFAYHSEEGNESKYKATVRNELISAVVVLTLEDGKDFIMKDDDGNLIARASRSYKWSDGVERMFKVAKLRQDGRGRKKGLEKVTPDELRDEVKKIAPRKTVKFDSSVDPMTDPKDVARWMFGDGVEPKDLLTAESVIRCIKERLPRPRAEEIFKRAVEGIRKKKLPIPEEIEEFA